MCVCDLCKFGRRIDRTIQSGSHRQKNRLIRELENRLLHVEDDLNYEHCIADGSWPTAVEILEHRLKFVQDKMISPAA